jgi:hypothetical protein
MDDLTLSQVRLLLHDAQEAGFRLEVADGNLQVSGPRDRQDILPLIKAHKAALIEAISHPEGIGEDELPWDSFLEYEGRLRKGIDWLETCRKMVDADPANDQITEAFCRNLHAWADLDEELRQVFPEFRGCPIDGCKATAPVRCLHCANPA